MKEPPKKMAQLETPDHVVVTRNKDTPNSIEKSDLLSLPFLYQRY
jgi:hypothetical protein